MSIYPLDRDSGPLPMATVDETPTIQLDRGALDPITRRRVKRRGLSPRRRAALHLGLLTTIVGLLGFLVFRGP